MTVDEAMQTAIARHQAGQLPEAETIYRQVLAAQPNHAEALHLLGVLAGQLGQNIVAIDLITKAITLRPNHFEAYSNLANFLTVAGRLDEAVAACQRAIQLNPRHVEAYNNLGDELKKQNRPNDALAAFDRAIALRPNHASAHNNRGVVFSSLGEWHKALAAYHRAIEIDPGMASAHGNLAKELTALHRFEEAVAAYRKSLQINPNDASIHWSLSLVLLTMGHFEPGWVEFEWRTRCRELGLGRDFAQPQWSGEPLSGKTLLIHSEGGYGDALQFVRYIPLLKDQRAKIILECHPPLAPLFANVPGVNSIAHLGAALPSFDFHVPLQSLPRLYRMDLSNIPNSVPYLMAPAKYVNRWQPRVRADGLKVGLVWAGASHNRLGADRRITSAEFFKALSQLPGVQYFSLQKGPGAHDPRPPDFNMIDFSDDLHDFADTAAVVEFLDLVITVDTSVAHLAGALARPVWILLPFSADFRWLCDRTDSPWYPTARLFRQKSPDDVTGQLGRMRGALKELCR